MLRSVVEEPNFTSDLDSFRRLYNDMESAYEAFSFALAESPRIGERMRQAPDFWIYTTKPVGEVPAFWILYRFDSDYVYLHSIEPVNL